MAKLTHLLMALFVIALLSSVVRYSAEMNEWFWYDIYVCEKEASHWEGPIPVMDYRCMKKDPFYNWSHCYIDIDGVAWLWFKGDLVDRHYLNRYHQFPTTKMYFQITKNETSMQNWYRAVLTEDAVKACRK